MKRAALLAALLLLAGCASTTRTPLASFPWINAIRHAPPVLAWRCESARGDIRGDFVFCHPDPDAPPQMDQAAHLSYDPDGTGGWSKVDSDPAATPCLKHCGDPAHPGCWGICERAGIDPRSPQQKAPPGDAYAIRGAAHTALPQSGAPSGTSPAPSAAEQFRCLWFGERDERQALACGDSSTGRAAASHAGGFGFESRSPLSAVPAPSPTPRWESAPAATRRRVTPWPSFSCACAAGSAT